MAIKPWQYVFLSSVKDVESNFFFSSRGLEIIHLQGQMNGIMLAFNGALNILRHVYGVFLSLILCKINF